VALAFNKKRSRSPVEGPLRRLAGQSIREERERLLEDKVTGYLFVPLAAWLLAIWEWINWWIGSKPNPGVATLVASIVTVYCVYRLWRFRPEFRNLNLGEKGERRVSEVLQKIRGRRWITLDDLALGGVNIDHVVVGPGGIFAIETKAYSVFGNGLAGIGADGALYLSGKPALKDPLKQARASATLVSSEVKRWMDRQIWVKPVVILPGWRVDPPKVQTDVVVLNEENISEFFNTRTQALTDSDIHEICSHLDRSARS
jgi:hypothetical protein